MQKYYGLIEAGFTALIVFGLGFWQLWSLRDSKRDRKRKSESETGPSPRDGD